MPERRPEKSRGPCAIDSVDAVGTTGLNSGTGSGVGSGLLGAVFVFAVQMGLTTGTAFTTATPVGLCVHAVSPWSGLMRAGAFGMWAAGMLLLSAGSGQSGCGCVLGQNSLALGTGPIDSSSLVTQSNRTCSCRVDGAGCVVLLSGSHIP